MYEKDKRIKKKDELEWVISVWKCLNWQLQSKNVKKLVYFLNFKIWLWLLYCRRGLNPFSHFSNEDDSCHEQQGSDDNADDWVDKGSFRAAISALVHLSFTFLGKDSDSWGLSFGAEILASSKGVIEVAFVAGQAIELSQMGAALGVSNSSQYK